MKSLFHRTSRAPRVFLTWLLASATLGGIYVLLTISGGGMQGHLEVVTSITLGVALLATPIFWWLKVETTPTPTPTGLSRFDSQERLHELIDNLPAIVARFDVHEKCLFANQSALRIQGLTEDQAVGRYLGEALPAAAYALYAEHIPIVMAGQRTAFEGTDVRNGKLVHFLVTLVPERDAHDTVIGFFLMTSDITAVKQAQNEVRRSEARLRAITDNLPVMICSIDTRGLLQFVNKTFELRTGVSAEAAVGRPFRELIGETSYLQAERAINSALGGTRSQFEVATDLEGTLRYWQGLCVPDIDLQGIVTCVYALLTDITTVRKSELNMTALALTDALTGLPNRRHLDERLPDALAQAHRQAKGFALLFLDIDHFKQINDQHGHAVGDAVLTEFARRLRLAVRSSDCVARYAGDEFVVVLEGIGARQSAEHVATEILAKVREPMHVAELALGVTTSIGVTYLSPGLHAEAQTLLDAADQALYQSKAGGRNSFSTCDVGTSTPATGCAPTFVHASEQVPTVRDL